MARFKQQDRETNITTTRQALIDAAIQCFSREGYAEANINRISENAGFAKGTIYNYFPSKQALMDTIIETVSTAHVQYITEQVLAEHEIATRLEKFFEAGFSFVSGHPAEAHLIISLLYGTNIDFREHLYRAYLPMFDLIQKEILEPGITVGLFQAANPTATTTLLMTIYLGTASQVDPQGRVWLDPKQVAHFVMYGLKKSDIRGEA